MGNLVNQHEHWNNIHSQGGMEEYGNEPTSFAKEVIKEFPEDGRLLELGCGLGNDSIYFANQGYTVIGTDFSDAAINQNSQKYKQNPNLSFQIVDMSKELPFDSAEFDVVYARLSLHYFDDQGTKRLFSEITRVLKSNGIFCFVCKSTDDPLFGQGEQLEKDMFLRKGHIRHFFSKEYAQECLADNYTLIVLESGKENFYGDESGYIKVIARKIK